MEIINTVGMNLFMGAFDVDRGAEWSSSMSSGFWFGYLLNGQVKVERPEFGEKVWGAGDHAYFWLDRNSETRHQALHEGSLECIFLHISPENLQLVLGDNTLDSLTRNDPNSLSNLDLTAGPYAKAIRSLAWQMAGCPLNGVGRNCYLAGKALEMIATVIDPVDPSGQVSSIDSAKGAPQSLQSRRTIGPDDIERLHHARDIILKRLDDPPTVLELAQAVGVNSRKLSDGFTQLFGVPVYSFIKTARLQAARMMIEAGETSMSKVAYAFGYSPSHFTTEFRKRYGISPKALSKGERPQKGTEN
ncbi:MAG: AraC family transcriptional regulator [Pseudomonadota bacterium]